MVNLVLSGGREVQKGGDIHIRMADSCRCVAQTISVVIIFQLKINILCSQRLDFGGLLHTFIL